MELRWTDNGRECVARFRTEAEAVLCAQALRPRDGIQNVQLLHDDGEPSPTPGKETRTWHDVVTH
jgi:hypothetical protein